MLIIDDMKIIRYFGWMLDAIGKIPQTNLFFVYVRMLLNFLAAAIIVPFVYACIFVCRHKIIIKQNSTSMHEEAVIWCEKNRGIYFCFAGNEVKNRPARHYFCFLRKSDAVAFKMLYGDRI